jgi:hypothetical protein
MLFEPFRPPKPENRIFRRYAVMLKMLAVLAGKDRGGNAKCGLRA